MPQKKENMLCIHVKYYSAIKKEGNLVICNNVDGSGGSQVVLVVKNAPANAGDARDVGLRHMPYDLTYMRNL